METQKFDCIIIGGGPAGITAGIYATRAGMKTVLIEEMVVGGQAAFTSEIDNYPGFQKISGIELGEKFSSHAEALGVEMVFDTIAKYEIEGETKRVETVYSGAFEAPTIILCLGAKPRRLGAENEEKFIGNGISFCATCDGSFYNGKEVIVVGGGNSALEEALFLSKVCTKVHLLHILSTFQANASMVEKVKNEPKIDYVFDTEVKKVIGDEHFEAVLTVNSKTGEEKTVKADGMFVAIGRIPNTKCVEGAIEMDNAGYIKTDENMATNLPGVFVAGDARQKRIRQIITACSDGAIAAVSANTFLIEK